MIRPEPTYPNWFAHYAIRFFERHLSTLAGQSGLRFLQIGAFTGDASVWLLDTVLTGHNCLLVDVDTWKGSDEPEHADLDWTDVRAVYERRTLDAWTNGRLETFRGSSADFFASGREGFDFAYIDGDHTAAVVLDDAIGAFCALKPGGLLAFDDYLWKPSDGGGPTRSPGAAIDAFGAVYADRLEVLETGLQVWFRKTA